ncbi:MAG: LD-carboxypeptidase [Deltaproteobacteria bacterium]|nr:LD-carboxypeptidase [Deltaproteobacteria bacterium]
MIIPRAVARGATLGVVAPAGVVKPDALERGLTLLRSWGFAIRVGEHVLARRRYCAGTPEQRAHDLQCMIQDPDIAAVICARGGYGTVQVLPLLDPELFIRNPKLVCGYSDVSPLLGFLVARCGLVTLHGPMVASDFAKGVSDRAATRWQALLAEPASPWSELVPEAIAPGVAEGRVVGGCLSSLVALLGTPFAIETDRAVLFLEDVAERPYRLDRMLTQLRLAGKLERVAAVVLGSFADCDGREDGDVAAAVFREFFAGAPYPVVTGFPAGHLSENLPITLGVPVRVDAGRLRVEVVA